MLKPHQSGEGYAVLTFPPAAPGGKPITVVIQVHASELQLDVTYQSVHCHHPQCEVFLTCLYAPAPPNVQKYVLSGRFTQYAVQEAEESSPIPSEPPALTDGQSVDSIDT